MKRAIAALLMLVAAVTAEPITVITNYFPGYICTTSGWQTVSESGLSTNVVYACFPISALPAATAAALAPTGTASDVRILLYAINDAAYTNYTALASTNRPANMTLGKNAAGIGITGYTVIHSLQTKWTLQSAVLTPE